MEPKGHTTVAELQAKVDAFISYGVYLKLVKRCGVIHVPVHGWVA